MMANLKIPPPKKTSYPQATYTPVSQFTAYARLSADFVASVFRPTVYLGTCSPGQAHSASSLRIYYIDQSTGLERLEMVRQPVPSCSLEVSSHDVTAPEFFSWDNELVCARVSFQN